MPEPDNSEDPRPSAPTARDPQTSAWSGAAIDALQPLVDLVGSPAVDPAPAMEPAQTVSREPGPVSAVEAALARAAAALDAHAARVAAPVAADSASKPSVAPGAPAAAATALTTTTATATAPAGTAPATTAAPAPATAAPAATTTAPAATTTVAPGPTRAPAGRPPAGRTSAGTGHRLQNGVPAFASDGPGRVWPRRAVLGALAAVPVVGAVRVLRTEGFALPSQELAGSFAQPVGAAVPGPVPGAGGPARVTISDENARPGTTDWQIPQDGAVWEKVRGYANRTSVAVGETVDLFVTTAGRTFTATAFRMGYYGGAGGRQVWTSGTLPGQVQAPPRVDRSTNMRDAPWVRSASFVVDASWVPGAYLIKLVSENGGQSQIPLVVRDDAYAAPVHIQHDVTTWQAYNLWGGANLYEPKGARSTVVSFDRPYDRTGSGHYLGGVYEIAGLVESLGLEVTYSTSIDTHAHPERIKQHRLWISPAHDEYWSLEMRDGLEAARDAGTNVMFLGANAVFRRIRLQPSPIGPDRQVVNYRTAKLDPLNGIDPARVTTSWREDPLPRPESSLTGTYYESNPVSADMVLSDTSAWMFDGVGVKDGDRWATLVGNEYDRVTPEVPTPPSIQVLAHSPVVCRKRATFADMTYYTTESGAGVFSSGSIWFERRLFPDGSGRDAQLIAMVTNILQVFAAGPAGRSHPSVPNLERFGIRPGYVGRVGPDSEDTPASSRSGSAAARR